MIASTTPNGIMLIHTLHIPNEADDFIVMPTAIQAAVKEATNELATFDRSFKLHGVMERRLWPTQSATAAHLVGMASRSCKEKKLMDVLATLKQLNLDNGDHR